MRALVKLRVVAAVLLWLRWWGAFVRPLGMRAGSYGAIGRDYLALSCPKTGPYCCLLVCCESSRVEKYKFRYVCIYIERYLSLSCAIC